MFNYTPLVRKGSCTEGGISTFFWDYIDGALHLVTCFQGLLRHLQLWTIADGALFPYMAIEKDAVYFLHKVAC